MTIKTAYQEKLHHQMEEWKAEIKVLEAKLGKMSADAKIKANKELDSLKEHQKKAVEKLDELKEAGDDVWEQMKAGVELAWEEVKQGMTSFKKHFD